MSTRKATDVGLEERHRKGCATEQDKRCSCGGPSYLAVVWDKTTKKKVTRTFSGYGAKSAAGKWRRDTMSALDAGTHESQQPAASTLTVREAADQWAKDAADGIVRTRSRDPYKPGAIRSYQQSLRLRVLDRVMDLRGKGERTPRMMKFGDAPVVDVRPVHIQALVDEMEREGHAPPTVVGAITALRVVLKRVMHQEHIDVSPVVGVELPAVRSRRERFAAPDEAARLLAALPEDDRAVWATAFYAGLRRGELIALRWEDVDLSQPVGTIFVRWSWDIEHGQQETKNRDRRRVPVPSGLREYLLAHKLRQEPGAVRVFGREGGRPLSPTALSKRADAAWNAANDAVREQAEKDKRDVEDCELLNRITLHECRHSYASFSIAAGVNAKALCDYMGHSSIKVTYDKYGHLMPGNEAEAAGLLDNFLTAAVDA